ncbi:unnamed protein product [Prunus armeniaca]|uniref:Uncharacterized protein n=1 Tax=Prunus armeniaca TaxID=36596 RepID=A0A6J5XP50_PRUAR|nr:unnamed protein product [Prunus armeniaca]
MGGCFSDVRGGKEAVGGAQPSSTVHNDAVEFFYRSHGAFPLFSQLEVLPPPSSLLPPPS